MTDSAGLLYRPARLRALFRAWRESALDEAEDFPSRRRASKEARDRLAEAFLLGRRPAA